MLRHSDKFREVCEIIGTEISEDNGQNEHEEPDEGKIQRQGSVGRKASR